MSDDLEGKKALVVEIHDRFHAMKTWGKDPGSLESITRVFLKDLAQYPIQQIMQAMSIYCQKNDEFPTSGAIARLIRFKGKEPISHAEFLSAEKIDPYHRKQADWDIIEGYKAQQRDDYGWDDSGSRQKIDLAENLRLREQVKMLEAENERLSRILQNRAAATED